MKLKKYIVLITVLSIVLLCVGGVVSADGITVTVNNKNMVFDTEPILQNDRLLVPMRSIFEALGADVSWNDITKTAVAVSDNITVKITVGEDVIYRNGKAIGLDVAAVIKNDRTLVPLRAVSEGLGADVEWNEKSYKVIITITSADRKIKTYSLREIGETDYEKFKSDKSAREMFENTDLPNEISKYSDDFADDIKNNVSNAEKYIKDMWNHCQTEALVKIMIDSEAEYQIEDDNIEEMFSEIISKAGKDAENQMKITSESGMLIIEFENREDEFADFICLSSSENSFNVFYAYESDGKTDIFEMKSGKKEKIAEISGVLSEELFRNTVLNLSQK